jgi:hypothetical protein
MISFAVNKLCLIVTLLNAESHELALMKSGKEFENMKAIIKPLERE